MRRRDVWEWVGTSSRAYDNPFLDVRLEGRFAGLDGREVVVPGFFDGAGTWRVRFSPDAAGSWRYRIGGVPDDPQLADEGEFAVDEAATRGFLRTAPNLPFGFAFESGEPVFVLGDTFYNLFGWAHCGLDVGPLLERRARQGFNLLRARLSVSPSVSLDPRASQSLWHTRSTWPWGGSPQAPQFDRFDLGWFRTVDRVVRLADRLGLGLELIMEGFGFEFPFNSRQWFTPEWEEAWLRYLVARYDAFAAVWFWTPLNEYEYYPRGEWLHSREADRWLLRIARWLKATAPHGHPVACHNGPVDPPFAERFRADPAAIDAILFQEWGSRGPDDGWLAAGIDEQIGRSLGGWTGSALLAEYGYERNPDLPAAGMDHRFCDAEHTRRGAWRGVFCGLGLIHGFDNTWGPFAVLDEDQPGLAHLLTLRRFLTEVAPFARLRPAPDLVYGVDGGQPGRGGRPLCLATAERDLVAVYLPTGGAVGVRLPAGVAYHATWFDPVGGGSRPAAVGVDGVTFAAPPRPGRPGADQTLVLSRADGNAAGNSTGSLPAPVPHR